MEKILYKQLSDNSLQGYLLAIKNTYPDVKCIKYCSGVVILCSDNDIEYDDNVLNNIIDTTPAVKKYNSDELISWALQQNFAPEIMAHMAAFLDFANKATEISKNNFLAYANAVGLTDTATNIISKAIEFGANITQ